MQSTRSDWRQLLADAARLCGEHGVIDPETFMTAAWNALVTSQPELLARLAELQLLGQLEELRRSGRMAEA